MNVTGAAVPAQPAVPVTSTLVVHDFLYREAADYLWSLGVGTAETDDIDELPTYVLVPASGVRSAAVRSVHGMVQLALTSTELGLIDGFLYRRGLVRFVIPAGDLPSYGVRGR